MEHPRLAVVLLTCLALIGIAAAAPPQPTAGAQELVIPFWSEERGSETAFFLRNNSQSKAITVKLVVRASGAGQQTTSVTLRPRQARELPIPIFFPGVSGDFGYALLRFNATNAEAVAALAAIRRNSQRQMILAVPLPTSDAIAKSELLVYRPDAKSGVDLVLSNLSQETVVAELSTGEKVPVAALSTSRVALGGTIEGAGTVAVTASAKLLITPIAFNGAIASSISRSESTRRDRIVLRSSPLRFFDGAAKRSQTVLLHNGSQRSIETSTVVHLYEGTESTVAQRIPLTLPPRGTTVVPLEVQTGQLGKWASTDVEFVGSNGEITALLLASKTGAATAYALTEAASAAWVSTYWTLSAETALRVANTTSNPSAYAVTLYDRSGAAAYELVDLQLRPLEDRIIDFAELRRHAAPDHRGRTVPNLDQGTFEVRSSLSHPSVFAAAASDSDNGDSPLGFCCGRTSPYLDPDPWMGAIGFIGGESPYVWDTCLQDYVHGSGTEWFVDNVLIASVSRNLDGTGRVTARSVGYTFTNATVDTWLGGWRCGIVTPQQVLAATQVYEPTPAVLLGPTMGTLATYSGGPLLDCYGGTEAPVFYGYSRCATYTVLDQNGQQIREAGLEFHEVLDVTDTNAGLTSRTADGATDGNFFLKDFFALGSATQGPRQGDFAFVRQTITAIASGRAVRVNCLAYSATDVVVTDITSNPDAPCHH